MQRASSVGDYAALAATGLVPLPPVQALETRWMLPLADVRRYATSPPRGLAPSWSRTVADVRRRLLARVLASAGEQHAAGIVDVRFRNEELGTSRAHEGVAVAFSVTAVPVTWTGRSPAQPFAAALAAADVLALLQSGWAPAAVLIADSRAIRDPALQPADAVAVTGGRNAEIPGYSDVRQRALRMVRDSLATQARALGADGVLMQQAIETRTVSTRRVVEAVAVATAVVAVAATPSPGMPGYVAVSLQA